MKHFIKAATAVAALAAAGSAAQAQLIYAVQGQLTGGENLAFAVINGNLLASNPEPGDFLLPFSGFLTIDLPGTVTFEFGGSFTSPNRSYTFDVFTPNVVDGLEAITPNNVIINDVFDGFDFELALNIPGETGTFSFFEPGVVPTNPAGNRSAQGFFTDVELVQVPAAPTAVALAGVGLIASRRRTRSA